VLFDCPAPPSLFREVLPDWALGAYLQELADSSGRSIALTDSELLALTQEPQRDERALEVARRHGIIPEGLTADQLACRVATYAANVRAVLAYQPAGMVDADVVSFRGSRSPFPEGWARWTHANVTRIDVQGDHYTMLAGVGSRLERLLHTTPVLESNLGDARRTAHEA
jgi:hypothetical protein